MGPVGSSHIPTRWTQKAAIGFFPPVTPLHVRPFIGGAKTPFVTSRVSHLEQVSPFNLQDFFWIQLAAKNFLPAYLGIMATIQTKITNTSNKKQPFIC